MASGVPGSPPGLPGPLRAAPPPSKGGTGEPSNSRLRDPPNTRHILWAAGRLREALQDISALSWFYPSRKCHRCCPSVLLNRRRGGGEGAGPAEKAWAPSGQPPHCTAHPGTHTRSCAYTHSYTLITYTQPHTHARTHTCSYAYTCILITYTLIYVHTHTHIHTLIIYTLSYIHNHNTHS